MADVSDRKGLNETSLEMLSADILLLIFESLSDCSPELLQSLRLVSRIFNIFATPIRYRSITLCPKLLDHNTVGVHIVRQNMRDHTQHVKIKTKFDWDLVVKLLSGCGRLKSMTWSVLPDNFGDGFPKVLNQAIHDYWPDIRLNITRIDCPLNHRASYPGKNFPALNIVDILVDNLNIPSLTEPLQALLVASQNLESLRISFLRHPFVSRVGKLPAVRKLVLGPMIWDYTPAESLSIWDFSLLEAFYVQLETLANLAPILEIYGLARLTRLTVAFVWSGRSHGEDTDAVHHMESTLLLRQIIEKVPHHQLQELDIKCCLSGLPIASLSCHGDSLRTVSLLDVSGFETDGLDAVTISVPDLQILLKTCTQPQVYLSLLTLTDSKTTAAILWIFCLDVENLRT